MQGEKQQRIQIKRGDLIFDHFSGPNPENKGMKKMSGIICG